MPARRSEKFYGGDTSSVIVNATEMGRLAAFAGDHAGCEVVEGYPARFSVESTNTGIGPVIVVKCLVCHAERNVSDLDSW